MQTISVDITTSHYFNVKEEAYELHLTGMSQGDPQVQGVILATGFARILPASRGAHCRPLHPRLASLCSALKTVSSVDLAA